MKFEKAKVALEKQNRRRSRQIFDPKTQTWEWTTTRRHPKELKNWGKSEIFIQTSRAKILLIGLGF